MIGIVLVIVLVLMNTSGQLLMKAAAQSKSGSFLLNPFVYFAFGCFFAVPFVVNLSLDYFTLKSVYSITGLYFIAVPVLSYFIFREQVSFRNVCGFILIVAGVIVFNI